MSWNSKPLSYTLPITIVKYELHPAWPIYHFPEANVFELEDGALRLLVKSARTCYCPGETIVLAAEVLVALHPVIPRSVEFKVIFFEEDEATAAQSSGFLQPPGSSFRKSLTRTINQQATTCNRLGHTTEFAAHLMVQVPENDIKPTLTSPNIKVTYTLAVTTNIHSQHLRVDVPIIISPLPRSVIHLSTVFDHSMSPISHLAMVSEIM
jgi:hypothetical protein